MDRWIGVSTYQNTQHSKSVLTFAIGGLQYELAKAALPVWAVVDKVKE